MHKDCDLLLSTWAASAGISSALSAFADDSSGSTYVVDYSIIMAVCSILVIILLILLYIVRQKKQKRLVSEPKHAKNR